MLFRSMQKKVIRIVTGSESRAYKLLGIYFDEHLSFSTHISHLTSKLSKAIYCINRAKNLLPKNALKSLYHSLFHSHLNYCASIVGCASNSNLDRIAKLQKKIVRIITHSNYTAHTEPLFKKLNILPYRSLITYSKLTLMHSIHYKTAPSALLNIWPRNADLNPNYALRNINEYFVPRSNFSFFINSPAHSFTTIWNSHQTITPHQNFTTFKIAAKWLLLHPDLA